MGKPYYKSNKCLICGGKDLSMYLSLGKSALANSFLKPSQLKEKELKVPLEAYFCNNCNLAQLLHIVDRGLIFKDYAYFSSTSPMLVKHFEEYAIEVDKRFSKLSRGFVVDIGSNDGVLLKPFNRLGAKVLGIDPAKNIAKVANKEGIETLPVFFETKLVPKLIKKYGKADIITSNNMMAHTDILHDIVGGVKNFLSDEGIFVFEVQYLADLLEHNEFDNTYHEHICFHSVRPLSYLLKMYDMEIIDLIHTDTHGGGIMVFATHSPSKYPTQKIVNEFITREIEMGLHTLKPYINFAKRPELVKKKLTALLNKLKKKGKRITAYGASAKATTLLQYCNIGPETIDYITESSPSKVGKFTPGTHIPIVSEDTLRKNPPDYILITAWNYAKNIMEKKEKWFSEQGGRFIIPIPEPVVV